MNAPLDVVDRLRDIPEFDLQFRSRAELSTFREELRSARDGAYATMKRISDAAGGHPLTAPQRSDYDAATRRCETAGEIVERVEGVLAGKTLGQETSGEVDLRGAVWSQSNPSSPSAREMLVGSADEYRADRPLTRSQSVVGFTRSRGDVRPGDDELSLEKYLRGVVTGDWSDAAVEQRAMAEGAGSSGGFMVPTLLSSQIIDLARNKTRVFQAGASILPMQNQTVTIAKWTGDPSTAWHSENAAITPSDATMGQVILKAKALASLTVVSRELIEDAPNVGTELANSFAASFAIKVDKAALYGTGVDPEPKGVKNTSGIGVQSMGTNGAVMSTYDVFVDAVGTLQDNNEAASGGIIVAPRTVRELNKLKDTTGQPLEAPPVLNDLPFLVTNQVPITNTQGTSTDASDAFVADWSQLIVGIRTQLMIEPLRERYADFGQLGFVSWWRGDIAVARPAAFVNIVGIR